MTFFVTRAAIAAGLLIVTSIAAQAADLAPRSYKAPIYTAPSGYSWTGFYIGLNAGYHLDKDSATTAANPVGWGAAGAAAIDGLSGGSVSPKGFIGGTQFGYNWQFGRFVAGIEADVDLAQGSASRSVTGFPVIAVGDTFTTSAKMTAMASLRPRFGYVIWDRGLVYATGGVAVARLKFTDTFTSFGGTTAASIESDQTKMGWVLGGGFEYGIFQNWTARIEYLYSNFGTVDAQIPSCFVCTPGSDITVHHKYTDNVVRLGVNYRF